MQSRFLASSPVCMGTQGIVDALLYLVIPIVVSLLAAGILHIVAKRVAHAGDLVRVASLLYGAAVVGACVGLLVGWNKDIASESATVGILKLVAAAPAFITLLGSAILYLFKGDFHDRGLRWAPAAIALLALSICFSLFYSQSIRDKAKLFALDNDLHRHEIEKQYIDVKIEFLKKAISERNFDDKLFRQIFADSTTAKFRFGDKPCDVL